MSTIFAMRMANERDQAIIRSAVSDAAASLLAFVPSLGTREVFAFGEGVSLPTRLRFAEVAEQHIPRSSSVLAGRIDPSAGINDQFIARVVDRWRGVTTSSRPKLSEPPDEGLWGSTETVLRGPANSLGIQSNLWGADTAGPAPAAPEPRKPMSEWTKHKLAQARKPLDRWTVPRTSFSRATAQKRHHPSPERGGGTTEAWWVGSAIVERYRYRHRARVAIVRPPSRRTPPTAFGRSPLPFR